jgi:hypothetical protein
MSDNRYRERKLSKALSLFWEGLKEEQKEANKIINQHTLSVI